MMSAQVPLCTLIILGKWDAHWPIITDLHQNRHKTLKELVEIMQDEHLGQRLSSDFARPAKISTLKIFVEVI
jgi:hypothetical protein